MGRRRAIVGASLLAALAIAFGGFYLLSDPLRRLESAAVVFVVHAGSRVSVSPGHVFQVLPADSGAFRADLTPFCSSLVPVLALASIAVFVLNGPVGRRVLAFTVSAAVVVVCNVLRIAASLWFGLKVGPEGLVLFHDWVGTLFGLVYTMVGFFLMIYVLLPKATTQMQRAARVSDVL